MGMRAMGNKPLKILIVEDEFITAYHIGTMLGRSGYEVAGNPKSGEEAIRAVLQTAPDVILMDVKLLGEVDGIDAAAEIKKRFSIPIIYLTAYSDAETLTRISQTNPYGYLLKPVNPDNLKAAIEISHSKSMYDRKLKESERRYLGIVENMPMYLCRFLPDTGEITFTNRHYRIRLGKEESELVGTNFYDVVHGGNGAALQNIFESLTISTPRRTLEVVIVEDESRRWERWIARRCTTAAGICLNTSSLRRIFPA
jgi:DNA-binding NarL/FixJ family response regulator